MPLDGGRVDRACSGFTLLMNSNEGLSGCWHVHGARDATVNQPDVVSGRWPSLAGAGDRNGAYQPLDSSDMVNVESSPKKDRVTHRGLIRNLFWRRLH